MATLPTSEMLMWGLLTGFWGFVAKKVGNLAKNANFFGHEKGHFVGRTDRVLACFGVVLGYKRAFFVANVGNY